MARTHLKTDSKAVFQRYFQRIYQRIDRELDRELERPKRKAPPLASLQELMQLKITLEYLFRMHSCDNLDALKWELESTFPRYKRFF